MNALESFYASHFNQQSTQFPAWFSEFQLEAFENYQKQGLPTRKTEQWKYASLEGLKQFDCQLSEISLIKEEASTSITIEDGNIVIPTALPEGITILPLSQAMQVFERELAPLFISSETKSKQAHCFEHINVALMEEGVFIHVDKNVRIDAPLTVNVHTTKSHLSQHLHHVVLVEEDADLTLVERFSGVENIKYFNNHVLQSIVKDNAQFEYVKVIEESNQAFHIGKTNLFLSRNATANCHSFSVQGAMIRSDINADLLAQGAHVSMNGLYLTAGQQNVAHYTRVNHLCPHASSDEVYKGILGGSSKGVFNGTIYVAKDAQKTDASQQNKNLLLSNKAEINTKPQLEIFADDVKCAHGATIGQLDDTALFYLQSRGITKPEAASLLVNAFAGDLIEKLSSERFSELKQQLHTRLEQHLRHSYDV